MLIYFVVLKEIFAPLVDLIYPHNCLICHKFLSERSQNNPVCKACWEKIELNLPPFCLKCGRHVSEIESICKSCKKKEYKFKRCFSVANYTGVIRDLIHLFKYKNKTSLSKSLARLMVNFFQTYNLSRFKFDYLVALPLHTTRLREREYNQTELLTREMSKMLGLNLSLNNLKRIKHTTPQSALKEDLRIYNIMGAFALKNPDEFAQKNILLVDDLLTTGATCTEAAQVLNEACVNDIYVLTLAITP
ncbi:MAG: ComF family protein [Candidatus Omnitrophota bacterium]|nr:ComF family protein [Candidatus Omnitrophota bacterium]